MIAWGAGMRWSQSATAWLGFFAAMTDGRVMLRHELTFIGESPEMVAPQIVAACAEWKIQVPIVLAQPEIFPAPDGHGETISETFRRHGVPMRAADDDRINGWSRVRSWLQPRRHGDQLQPSLVIHDDCLYFRRIFPTLVQDPKEPDDVLETPDEYPATALRFYLMSRPLPATVDTKPEPGPGTWGHALKHHFQPARRVIGDYLR